MKKITGLFLIACLVAFSAGTVRADDFHYTNLLIGDRAAGMGGAYTAVSDDATGLYYNPAGVVYSAGRNLSASVNAYYDTTKTYKSVIGGNGWKRRSSSLLPNYFGVVQPFGKLKIGLSYAVPESITADQDQVFANLPLSSSLIPYNPGVSISTYLINFNEESNTYNFGPSAAMELSDKISAGITLYYYQKKSQWILNQIIKTTNGGYEWTNDYFQTEEQGIRPVVGFMFTPMEKLSLGLALSKIMLFRADTKYQHAYLRDGIAVPVDLNNDGIIDTTVSNVVSLPDGQLNSKTKRKYPTQVSLGVAWFPSASLLLSGDVNYYTAVTDQNAKAVTNVALGAEYYLSSTMALRGGLFTDFANTPTIKSGGVNQSEHIDLYGGTASISHFTRNTSITIGGGYTYGDGQSQIVSDSTKIQDAEFQGWMLFLAASYSY